MKRIYSLLLLCVALLTFGCFQDKGNYEYENINKVTVDFQGVIRIIKTAGDSIIVKPKLIFEDTLNIDMSNYSFQWYLSDKVMTEWSTLELKTVATMSMNGTAAILRVTDKRNGVVSMASAAIIVSAPYDADGIYVLAEKDGKSELSFIKTYFTYPAPTYAATYDSQLPYHNLYESSTGESLGSNPTGFVEHSIQYVGNYLLIKQGSGDVDVNAKSFTKEIDFVETFVDATYPTGFGSVQDAFLMSYTDLAKGEDGKIYSRIKETSALVHSSYFIHRAISYEGEELVDCDIIENRFRRLQGTFLIDNVKKRLLFIFDTPGAYGSIAQENAGKVIGVDGIPIGGAPDGYIPLDNFGDYELLDLATFATRGTNNSSETTVNLLFKSSTGEYFMQSIDIAKTWGQAVLTQKNPKIAKITLPGNPISTWAAADGEWSNSNDIFLAVGKTLYRYDTDNPSFGAMEHITFNSNIKCMSSSGGGSYGIVVTENNNIYMFTIRDAKNLPADKRIMAEISPDYDFGNIIDAKQSRYKNGW